ncbi:MAG: TlpA disulfide reductase family protein [Bacillota bacterium]
MKKIRSSKWFILLIAVLLTTLLLGGCLKKKETPSEEGKITVQEPQEKQENKVVESEKPPKEETEAAQDYGVFPGDRAYDFTLLDREGNEIQLSSLKGKVVFVNFWTTWCGFCKQEMPDMQAVYEKYQDQDVVMLAVNVLAAEKTGTDMDSVKTFVDESGYTFPILFDVDGTVSQKYKVRALPTTYIIDKEGYISDFVSGAMKKETMIEKIEDALNKK